MSSVSRNFLPQVREETNCEFYDRTGQRTSIFKSLFGGIDGKEPPAIPWSPASDSEAFTLSRVGI